MKEYTLHTGDSIEVLKTFSENSIDSVVTDPPYELGFMDKGWDKSGVANSVELWKEVFRVLKPGGHLLSFGGSRTYHRMASAIEDAGFEIRDQIQWIYGSGFPKSHNISKALDKRLGVEAEIVGYQKGSLPTAGRENWKNLYDRGDGKTPDGRDYQKAVERRERIESEGIPLTVPTSDEAKKWEGWGTALKPAHEPIVLARKPIKNSVADNVLLWGTGALNIEGTRVSTQDNLNGGSYGKTSRDVDQYFNGKKPGGAGEFTQPSGRWPANIIFDEDSAQILDEQSGVSKSNPRTPSKEHHEGTVTTFSRGSETSAHKDSGGASRFFYVAKTSTAEREAGLESLEEKYLARSNQTQAELKRGNVDFEKENNVANYNKVLPRKNNHPTVKPITLMRYLVKLITPPDGLVLDPFCGSGSTGCAAVVEGFNFIGIDLDSEYIEISRARIEHWKNTFDKGK